MASAVPDNHDDHEPAAGKRTNERGRPVRLRATTDDGHATTSYRRSMSASTETQISVEISPVDPSVLLAKPMPHDVWLRRNEALGLAAEIQINGPYSAVRAFLLNLPEDDVSDALYMFEHD